MIECLSDFTLIEKTKTIPIQKILHLQLFNALKAFKVKKIVKGKIMVNY